MEVADIFYFIFGLFSLYAAYAIVTGQWDFSEYILPVGKSVGLFLGLS